MKHETGFLIGFGESMRELAERKGRRYRQFSFDGQDRDVGADVLLTDDASFAVIEMKYSDDDLRSEARKPRRATLCQKLQANQEMRALHDRCHFIAWCSRSRRRAEVNIYRKEICHCGTFPSAGLCQTGADTASRLDGAVFGERFFGSVPPPCSVTRDDLELYLDWVLRETASSSVERIELFINTGGTFGVMQAKRLRDVLDWLALQAPNARPGF